MQTGSGQNPQSLFHKRRYSVLGLFLTSIIAMGFAFTHVSSGHNWGGDFAGYLLQANALLERNATGEVALNRSLMDSSDRRIGPDAYPWGYPAILALITSFFGGSLVVLKAFSIPSIGLTTFLSGLLARRFGLGAIAAVCAAGLVGLQPDISSFANFILSDLYFLSFTTAALIFAALSIGYRASSASSAPNILAAGFAAVLVSLSFFVRSNGAVTMVAIAAVLLADVVASTRGGRRLPVVSALVFGATCAVLVYGYFSLLPDGSLVHASYLTLDPKTLLRRSMDDFTELGRFVPMVLLPESVRYLAVLGVLALCVLGAFQHRRLGLLMGVYLAGHILLITLFPFDGGKRYYFPLLPILAILSIAGVQSASMAIRSGAVKQSIQRWDMGRRISLLLIVGLIAIEVHEVRTTPTELENEPYSRASQEMFSFVRRQPAAIEPIAFFKPRVMRLLSGKRAVLINKINSVDRVNAIVLTRDVKWALDSQLAEQNVTTLPGFVRKFSNDGFSLYVRSAVGK
jgi:hypothetical protein